MGDCDVGPLRGGTHGEFVPGHGWYDVGLKGYVDKPSKVTPLSSAGRVTPRPEFGTPRTDRRSREEVRAESAARNWRPNAELEQLRTLQRSELSEQRLAAERMLVGQRRLELATYLDGLTAHIEAGGELPDGVRKP